MRVAVPLVLVLTACAAPAQAFCSYAGKDYATTTIAREFNDAKYVAEVEVLSGTVAYADEPDRKFMARWGEQGSIALFNVRVVRAYKGAPSAVLRFFTERNSGGFYFEKRWKRVAPIGTPDSFYVGRDYATDVGGRYLVFLNPVAPHRGMGSAERDAVFVNYACGQSKPWREVTGRQRALLNKLSRLARR